MLEKQNKNKIAIQKSKYVCYTLDLEEDHAGYLQNYYEGLNFLEDFINIIIDNDIKPSCFIQAKIIENFPEKIELIRSNNIDIHLHSYYHNLKMPKKKDLIRDEIIKSKEIYREFFGENPKGYRFPLGVLSEEEYIILNEEKFKFDSSIFPSLRPGYYFNLNKPLIPYRIYGILEIPISVISNLVRIPLSLSYMKLLYPLHFLINYQSKLIVFDFHMHDLYNLNNTKKLSFLRKYPYMRNLNKGKDIFLKFYKKLQIDEYESINIYKIYEMFK